MNNTAFVFPSTLPKGHIIPITTSTSTSTIHPTTSVQWRSTLESIKLLYLQRKYRQCAARCMEILDGEMSRKREEIHPVYKTYLAFYAAVSYEVLGRAAHQYSSNKIPLLKTALEQFVSCRTSLEDAVVVVDVVDVVVADDDDDGGRDRMVGDGKEGCAADANTATETMGSLMNSITRIIESSLICAEQDDPFVSDNEHHQQGIKGKVDAKTSNRRDDDDRGSDGDDHLRERPLRVSARNKDRLHPSPLRIRKVSVPVMMPDEENQPAAAEVRRTCSSPPKFDLHVPRRGAARQTAAQLQCPPPTPLPTVSQYTADLNLNARARVSETRLKTDKTAHQEHSSRLQTPMSAEQARHIARFNNTIASLRDQISTSTLAVQTLIDEVQEIQRHHHAASMSGRNASFWDSCPLASMPWSSFTTTSTVASSNGQSRMCLLGAKETKEQRIVRLRAEGWDTVGIKSKRRRWKGAEYYRALCGAVLDELYLER